jgi:hypothetical protein
LASKWGRLKRRIMIEITVSTTDHRGEYPGTRKKTFVVDAPQVEHYLKFIEAQGWIEDHTAELVLIKDHTAAALSEIAPPL